MNLPQRCVDYSSLSSLYYVNVNKHTVLIPHCNTVGIVKLSGAETTGVLPPIFVLPGVLQGYFRRTIAQLDTHFLTIIVLTFLVKWRF